MKRMNGLVTAFALAVSLVAAPALAQPVIEDITFSSQPGSKFEVRLDFSEPPPADFSAYTIEEPARIAIDFPTPKAPWTKSGSRCPTAAPPACWCWRRVTAPGWW